jgi:hypothetical protein
MRGKAADGGKPMFSAAAVHVHRTLGGVPRRKRTQGGLRHGFIHEGPARNSASPSSVSARTTSMRSPRRWRTTWT